MVKLFRKRKEMKKLLIIMTLVVMTVSVVHAQNANYSDFGLELEAE